MYGVRRVIRSAAPACRKMSSVVAEAPSYTISKNVSTLQAMGAATSNADLAAAKSAVHAPAASAAAAASSTGFTADATAWQNMAMGDYVAAESGRSDFWPFVVSGLTTFFLLGVVLPACLPKGTAENSKYIAMMEGKHKHHAEDGH